MTDIICDGRLDIGIARGAYSFEYERLLPGLDAWGAGQRLRELIPAVQGLWKGDYAQDGEFFKFPATTSSPKPLQQPNPPIWVAARDPNSHEFAVANHCNVQVTPLWQGDDEVEALMGRFNAACANNPDIPRPKIMLLRHTYVGSNEEDIAQAAHELSIYYNYFFAWFKNEKPVKQGLIERITEEDLRSNAMLSDEVMRTNNVVGNAAGVIERIRAYQALGYDEYSFWIDTGMSFERKKASLERFIAGVMPAFEV
jgi:alkanesulfonate monooxygenase SsuD/methylene tetrahydromethanopterin reductase-like flavin-dependent oxidoreductase (luciferase family)